MPCGNQSPHAGHTWTDTAGKIWLCPGNIGGNSG